MFDAHLARHFAARLDRSLSRYPHKGASAAPTARSIHHIERKLQVRIPHLLVEVAKLCPTYGSWFSDLSETFKDPEHILANNYTFHRMGLPARYVIFNRGFDGDCDCWDLENSPVGGEQPIVYVSLYDRSDGTREWYELAEVKPWASTTNEYLSRLCG